MKTKSFKSKTECYTFSLVHHVDVAFIIKFLGVGLLFVLFFRKKIMIFLFISLWKWKCLFAWNGKMLMCYMLKYKFWRRLVRRWYEVVNVEIRFCVMRFFSLSFFFLLFNVLCCLVRWNLTTKKNIKDYITLQNIVLTCMSSIAKD